MTTSMATHGYLPYFFGEKKNKRQLRVPAAFSSACSVLWIKQGATMEPLRLLLAWMVVLCYSFREIQAECARKQIAQFYINQCTTPLTTWSDFSWEGAQNLCNQSQEIADCIDRLIADCRGISDEAIDDINDIIDIGHMKFSFSKACGSFIDDGITVNESACIMDLYNETAKCRREAFNSYALKVRLLQNEVRLRGLEWFDTRQKVAACQYAEDLGVCAKAYNISCGRDIHEIYYSLSTGVRISNCPRILADAARAQQRDTEGCPHNPRDAVAALKRCIAPTEAITTFKDGLPTVEAVNDFCKASGEEVAFCMEKVVKCAEISPAIAAALNRTMNVEAMVRFLDFACVNNNLFQSQSACVRLKERRVNQCARNEYQKWLDRIQALQTAETSFETEGGFEQSVSEARCQYARNLTRCTVPWKFECNFKLGEIFDSLFDSTRDPLCDGVARARDLSVDVKSVAHIGLP